MKRKLFILVSVALFLIGGVFASQRHKDTENKGSVKEEISADNIESTAVEVGNVICPVDEIEIGTLGDSVKYEYKGKIYNFCCEMCVKSFEKDPEKYIKIIEESEDMDIEDSEEIENKPSH